MNNENIFRSEEGTHETQMHDTQTNIQTTNNFETIYEKPEEKQELPPANTDTIMNDGNSLNSVKKNYWCTHVLKFPANMHFEGVIKLDRRKACPRSE